jgi:integrase
MKPTSGYGANDKGPSGAQTPSTRGIDLQGGRHVPKPSPGVRRRHSAGCPAKTASDARCNCNAGYEATVYDPRARRKIRKTFATVAAARTWRSDAAQGVRRGTIRASEPMTVNDAADELVAGMNAATIRTRSGDRYKPSTVRAYRESLELHVRADLGAMRLGDVQRRHVQALADRLVADGHSASTVRNALLPLRVIYRRAIRDGVVAVNPCTGIDLPANRSERVEIVSVDHAGALVAALEAERDRALWAIAFYAGLRRGELMALRWGDVDLAAGVLRVERAYDPKAREYVDPKSRAGRRRVPIAAVLRSHLLELALASDRSDPDALVLGDEPRKPFDYDTAIGRARDAWANADLEPVGLHAARHTAASVMIAAGVNVKALSEFLGHSSITITLDRYGHLLPGSIAEATTLLDAFLARTGAPTGAPSGKALQIGDFSR